MYITALEGLVPVDITKTFNAFLDFCYIARKSLLTQDDLDALDNALQRFHHYRDIFRDAGVRPDGFSLPRQHAIVHYSQHIRNFGAPNGLCSSITESKHIAAVKKPWRRSNRYNALKQMLTINTRNDKLATAQVDFLSRGMLSGTCLGETLHTLSTNQEGMDEEVESSSGTGEDVDPADKDIDPADEDVDPADEDVDPADEDVDPADKDANPADKDANPANKDANPADEDANPADEDVDPADERAGPDNEGDHNNDLCGPIEGPPILGEVTLCSKKGMYVTTQFRPMLIHC